jgi:protein tyrosine phosphatase (PTP) superfamily phosphohydrolase (DUF442 family)
VLLALAVNAGYALLGPNFHAVLPGQIYRCAQPSPVELEQRVRRYGIRTVVNLRGCGDIFPWYLEECRATHRLNLSQEDVSLSAGRLPSVHELRRLVEVLDRSERPILMHCRRGADRTGLASAIVLLLYSDADLSRARRELGMRYGHVALGKTAQLNGFLDLYEEWLSERGQAHSPEVFRRWVGKEYCPAECRCTVELCSPLDVVPAGRPFGVTLRVRNTSIRPWRLRRGTNAGIHAIAVVYTADYCTAGTGRGGLFDGVVAPGEGVELTVPLPALPAGRYRLMADMIDEQHCWFMQTGSEPVEKEFTVRGQEAAAGGRPASAGLAGLANQLAPGR